MKSWVKVFIFFFISGLLLYSNSLNNKFLMDDYVFLSNPVASDAKFILSQWNPYHEQSLGVTDSQDMQGYYRPLQHIVLDLCYSAFKGNYWQYHLLNLLLFALASSLIFVLVETITHDYTLAVLTGFFYLIHPVNGIIVNYISASVFAFQLIFTICTVLLLIRSLEKNNDRLLYLVSLLFALLTLFWHESAIMAPFYISAVILYFRKESLTRKIFYLFPYFLIVLTYIIFRSIFFGTANPDLKTSVIFHMTVWEYLANLFRAVMWYFPKLIYPQGIVLNWATPMVHDHLIWYVGGICSLLALSVLFFLRFTQKPLLQMAIAWMVIGFIPVCLSAFIRPDIGVQIEPHWFVISSIGFFILAAYFCTYVLKRMQIAGLGLLCALIFTWAAISHANNQIWADQKTYALYWSQQAPDLKMTYSFIADAYQKQGDYQESQKYYRLSLAGDSDDGQTYYNLALLYQKQGHFKNAEIYYKIALFINPFSAGVYNNLGLINFVEGRLDRAREDFEHSLKLNPMRLEPRLGLASVYLKRSEYQKAIDMCLQNLDIVNDDPATLLSLVNIYIQKKDYLNLKNYAYRFINTQKDPGALTNLGILMSQNNIPVIALDCFEKALQIAPDYNDAYWEAGAMLANLGKYDQAIHLWKIGLSIDPTDKRFNRDIALITALKLK